MRILLDTHILLWALSDDPKLPAKARKLIENAAEIYVSAATFWELAIKVGLGKLNVNLDEIREYCLESGYVELPITSELAIAVKDLGHTLPGICIGSAVGAALAAFQGIDCYVPHGGFIVALATNNVALFCLDIVIGSVVAAAILIAMKPTLDKQAK